MAANRPNAHLRRIQRDPSTFRITMEDQRDVFVAGVMDPGTENIRLAVECPDPHNPRNTREAQAVAIMCQYGGLEVPPNAIRRCNNRQPPCPYRRLYTKAPMSENKTKANNYAIARDLHYGIAPGAPGHMQGVMAHAVDSAIANSVNISTRGWLVTVRDPEDIQADLDALQTRFNALQAQFDALQTRHDASQRNVRQQIDAATTAANNRVTALTNDVTTLRNERDGARRNLGVVTRERDDARQHLQAANATLTAMRGEVHDLRGRLTTARETMTGLLRERRPNAGGANRDNVPFISPVAHARLAGLVRSLDFDGVAGADDDNGDE